MHHCKKKTKRDVNSEDVLTLCTRCLTRMAMASAPLAAWARAARCLGSGGGATTVGGGAVNSATSAASGGSGGDRTAPFFAPSLPFTPFAAPLAVRL